MFDSVEILNNWACLIFTLNTSKMLITQFLYVLLCCIFQG